MSTTPLISSVIGGDIFVMGLVVAGTLADYRDAERAPTDVAASLYALLRETETMNRVWGKPDMAVARARLIAIVTSLRADITAGNTRECQAAIEEWSTTLEELEESDVPANYIVRLRSEQAAFRKSLLRVYHIQCEEFLPSAFAMIVSLVAVILVVVRAQLGDEAVEDAEVMESQVAQAEAQMVEVEAQEAKAAAEDEKASSGEGTV